MACGSLWSTTRITQEERWPTTTVALFTLRGVHEAVSTQLSTTEILARLHALSRLCIELDPFTKDVNVAILHYEINNLADDTAFGVESGYIPNVKNWKA